ncbi:MAG: hypothetical protein WBE34_14125 [Candidatus Nitrosopolaris sp.]
MAIEVLSIYAAELGEKSSFVLFGYRTAVGITLGDKCVLGEAVMNKNSQKKYNSTIYTITKRTNKTYINNDRHTINVWML